MRPHLLLRALAIATRFERPLRRAARAVIEPRKSRHRIFRVVLTLAGLALLAVGVVAAVAVGAVLITGGVLWRLLRRPLPPVRPLATGRGRVLDATYRVINRPVLSR